MQNLVLISNLLKRLQTTHAKKVFNEKVTEKSDFYYCAQKFSITNVLGWTCLHFFERIRTQHWILPILLLMGHVSLILQNKMVLLIFAFFANFKAKVGQNGSKKRKPFL